MSGASRAASPGHAAVEEKARPGRLRPATERMSSDDPRDEVWTVEETASYLRVPVATLYRWRYLGVGPPAHRVGKHLRFIATEIRQWVRAQ
jgi:excisionase family DNA binding protein